MKIHRINVALTLVLLVAALLTGCNATKEPLYHHGLYSEAVYGYFKVGKMSVSEQVTVLEEIIAEAQGKQKSVAPGVHAHLGMLYFEIGSAALGLAQFEQEKALFPESAHYIDFLIANSTGNGS